ncbi:hypothetical protein PQ478_12490 [Alkalihalophilus pseudofirmus]|uniref:hypothetical protein n=1 Tax=Alkalihalophilus pseudofirmus TaxID=79885 RepID=UPI00259BA033|nr:hypothetical protein [Alkalihalophilus pseudofirmus]WEG15357.1 hypothetical protein PQ478_12490 [Alkalihalophilus pseudofirmus]
MNKFNSIKPKQYGCGCGSRNQDGHPQNKSKKKKEKRSCACLCNQFAKETPVYFTSLVINGAIFRVGQGDPVAGAGTIAEIILTNINKKNCCTTVRIIYATEISTSRTYRDIPCDQLGPYILP